MLYTREKKLDFTNRKRFMWILNVSIFTIILDIFSVICIVYTNDYNFSPLTTTIICKMYVCSIVTLGYLSYTYVINEVFTHNKYRMLHHILHWSFVTGEFMIAVTPLSYVIKHGKAYSYGLSANIAYGLAFSAILLSLSAAILRRRDITHTKFVTLVLWQCIWLGCAIIQFLMPDILLISFAFACSIVLLYTQLENPNEHLDDETGIFNHDALVLYLKDLYKFQKPFALFTVKINYISKMTDFKFSHKVQLRTAKGLESIGNEPVFKIDDDFFCVIYPSAESMYAGLDRIIKLRDTVKDVPALGSYISIACGLDFVNSDELLKFIHAYESSGITRLDATEELLYNLRQYDKIQDMITDALNNDRIEVFYQPFYDVSTKTFSAAEALVRIKTDSGKIISPSRFITIAEETGQIIPLGMKIFEKICQFIATNDPKKYGLNRIEINLSVAQFDLENPAKFILEYIDKYKIDPSIINLEITETAQIKSKQHVLSNVEKLRSKGISFSLDDFGTGNSNLDYFVDLPVENIKFDHTFTQQYFTNDKIKLMIEGVIQVLKNMNMKIISEGVETKEQLDAMKHIGVDFIQGYYFSRPIPEQDFLAFLRDNNLSENEKFSTN